MQKFYLGLPTTAPFSCNSWFKNHNSMWGSVIRSTPCKRSPLHFLVYVKCQHSKQKKARFYLFHIVRTCAMIKSTWALWHKCEKLCTFMENCITYSDMSPLCKESKVVLYRGPLKKELKESRPTILCRIDENQVLKSLCRTWWGRKKSVGLSAMEWTSCICKKCTSFLLIPCRGIF